MNRIRVMVVEDSPVVREWLVHILESSPSITIVGTASDGEEAVQAAMRIMPDVITMDIHMPKLNGLDATRRIMEICPIPIIIVSGSGESSDVEKTFMAIEAGALAFVPRPPGIGHPDHESSSRELVRLVLAMSEVKLVRRWPKRESRASTAQDSPAVVAMGASTGGPPVIRTILSMMPKKFPLPILIVQHMSAGFLQGFADWLDQSSALPVSLAGNGEKLSDSRVYIAPDGCQMKVEKGGRIVLPQDEPENGLRPSVSFLFRSIEANYGKRAVA
ncbi:MAG TPA: chemotaxis protein CheB, partial [Burkholderiales bacterium]|nr:chemotaxis protein CheB [Burkholderiales bacterium]